nr:bloom syndrome protein [Hymenolepis microstoma]
MSYPQVTVSSGQDTSVDAQPQDSQFSQFECLGTPSGLTLTRNEINRLILEYLIVEGYKDAAEKFQLEIGIEEPLSEVHSTGASLKERMEIREAVLSRRIEYTIDRVNQLWPELFENNPYIYFQLRQLEMLELIRVGNLEKALTFAQTHLAGSLHNRLEQFPQLLQEVENTMALIAFSDPINSAYGSLLDSRHVELVAGALNRAILWHIESNGGEGDSTFTDNVNGKSASGASLSKGTSHANSATVPRLTKLVAMLLRFRNISEAELTKELDSI